MTSTLTHPASQSFEIETDDFSINDYFQRKAQNIAKRKVVENLNRFDDNQMAAMFGLSVDEVSEIRRRCRREDVKIQYYSRIGKPPLHRALSPKKNKRKLIRLRNRFIADWVQHNNKTSEDAAEFFELSTSTIRQLLKKADVTAARKPRPKKHDHRQIAEALRRNPIPMNQAVKAFECNSSTIRKIANNAGIQLPRLQPNRKRDAEILAMRKRGDSLGVIADHFGITAQRVSQILTEHNIPRPNLNQRRRDMLHHLRRHRMTAGDAAQKFGYSEPYLKWLCRKEGVQLAKKRGKFRRLKIADSLRRHPISVDQAARKFHCSTWTIRSIAAENKIKLPRKKNSSRIRANCRRDAKMAAMRRNGASYAKIGEAIGLSKQRVAQILGRFNLPTPDLNPERTKMIAHLRKHRMTAWQAAEKFGFGESYILAICKKERIALISGFQVRRDHDQRQKRNRRIAAMQKRGKSLKSIAETFNLSYQQVLRILKNQDQVRMRGKV